MADTDTVIMSIGASLSVLVQIAQGLYAKRKGKERDPQIKKIADCTEHIDAAIGQLAAQFEQIEARLIRLERGMAQRGISESDDHPSGPGTP